MPLGGPVTGVLGVVRVAPLGCRGSGAVKAGALVLPSEPPGPERSARCSLPPLVPSVAWASPFVPPSTSGPAVVAAGCLCACGRGGGGVRLRAHTLSSLTGRVPIGRASRLSPLGRCAPWPARLSRRGWRGCGLDAGCPRGLGWEPALVRCTGFGPTLGTKTKVRCGGSAPGRPPCALRVPDSPPSSGGRRGVQSLLVPLRSRWGLGAPGGSCHPNPNPMSMNSGNLSGRCVTTRPKPKKNL